MIATPFDLRAAPVSHRHYDAIIIGARPAGAATATLLARAGARVLVVDRDGPGADTLSTHALMRTAVVQLKRLGVLDRIIEAGTPAVRQTIFDYGDETVTVEIGERWGVDALYAPRRTLLDHVLVNAAREAGAEVRHGVRLDGLVLDADGRVLGARLASADHRTAVVTAGIVIGADGRNSTVARLVGAQVERRSVHRAASVFGYFSGIENHGYRWSYRPGSHAGVIPTNDGKSCIFVCVPRAAYHAVLGAEPTAGFLDVIASHDPELVDKLHATRMEGRLRRFGGAYGYLRRAHGLGWALVGDAGYFRDPVTAHGISDALRDAELLADSLIRGQPLGRYQETRDALSLSLFDTTDRIASFGWDMMDLKTCHRRLNRAMNAEIAHMAGPAGDLRSAA